MKLSVREIAELLGAEYNGDPETLIDHVAPLDSAQPSALSFLASAKFKAFLKTTQAGVVLLPIAFADDCPTSSIVVTDPYLAYARVMQHLYPPLKAGAEVHSSAIVAADAVIGNGVSIGAHTVVSNGVRIGASSQIGSGVFIGDSSTLGSACRLYPNVSIYHDCHLGDRVTVHANTVIGSDGFGYANDGPVWVKIPQIGRVLIGDDCEIGASTTIDRGALEDTVLERGVILDNQIQIAHNVHIGEDTAIAGCVGIAGSAKIGRRCRLGGGAGVLGHLEIADDVTVTAMSLVTSSIAEAGVYASGTPLEANQNQRRNQARFKQLHEMARRLNRVEKKINTDE